MQFIKVMYITDVGEIRHRMVNVSHIENIEMCPQPVKVYDSKGVKETLFPSVLKIKSHEEFPGYIDVSIPMEIETINDIAMKFVAVKEVEAEPIQEEVRRRGRPRKDHNG